MLINGLKNIIKPFFYYHTIKRPPFLGWSFYV
nr:MAG TPA: hypothetical protein [Caudoviricetes sp.]